MAIMTAATDLEIMECVDAILTRSKKQDSLRAVFRFEDNKIVDLDADSKQCKKHSVDFMSDCLGYFDKRMDAAELRTIIKRYRRAPVDRSN